MPDADPRTLRSTCPVSVRAPDTASEIRTIALPAPREIARLAVAHPVQRGRGMPCSYRPSSRLSSVFDALQLEIVALDRAWTCERERSGLRHTAGDLRHHVCAALAALETLDDAAPELPRYEHLDGVARVLAHEAYLSVLALGQLLRQACEDGFAPRAVIEVAQLAVEHMLDELTPHVSRADDALRRVLLDDASLEEALAGVVGVVRVARAP